MYDGFSELLRFTAVKQDGLYIGIEDPDFGVVGVWYLSLTSYLNVLYPH